MAHGWVRRGVTRSRGEEQEARSRAPDRMVSGSRSLAVWCPTTTPPTRWWGRLRRKETGDRQSHSVCSLRFTPPSESRRFAHPRTRWRGGGNSIHEPSWLPDPVRSKASRLLLFSAALRDPLRYIRGLGRPGLRATPPWQGGDQVRPLCPSAPLPRCPACPFHVKTQICHPCNRRYIPLPTRRNHSLRSLVTRCT